MEQYNVYINKQYYYTTLGTVGYVINEILSLSEWLQGLKHVSTVVSKIILTREDTIPEADLICNYDSSGRTLSSRN